MEKTLLTYQKRNQCQNCRFYSASACLPVGLIIVDRNDVIQFINKFAQHLLELDEAVRGKDFYECFDEESPFAVFWYEASNDTEKVSHEIVLGASRHIKASAIELRGQAKQLIGHALLLQDVVDNWDILPKVKIIAKQLLTLGEGNPVPSMCNNLAVLTKRELQIFKLLGEGLRNGDIAELLNISENTVKKHISNILHKLNISSRTEAALLAVQHGDSS